MQTHKLYVKGMHCKACVMLIESELIERPEIGSAKVHLNECVICVEGEFGDKSSLGVAEYLNQLLSRHSYTFHTEKPEHKVKWRDFYWAGPIAFGFILLFLILQKLGIVNVINTSDINFGTAILVGVIASLSSCMAVVGGLILSVSANFAKCGDKFKPQMLFHAGRLISFFFLGGVIGALGSVFQFGATGTLILSLLVGVVLLILGINLLDVLPWTKRFQIALPGFLGRHIDGLKNINHTLIPFLIGAATFFMPCGFTQSMQIFTLTTGSFWTGALMMGSFAIGTLPVLAILSFGSLGITGGVKSGVFFKAAGLIVIFFGIFNIINALVAGGFIPPLFNL